MTDLIASKGLHGPNDGQEVRMVFSHVVTYCVVDETRSRGGRKQVHCLDVADDVLNRVESPCSLPKVFIAHGREVNRVQLESKTSGLSCHLTACKPKIEVNYLSLRCEQLVSFVVVIVPIFEREVVFVNLIAQFARKLEEDSRFGHVVIEQAVDGGEKKDVRIEDESRTTKLRLCTWAAGGSTLCT